MYLRSLTLTNIRAIASLKMEFSEAEAPGWHVLLGANGAGKSSVVRSLALILAGPREAAALRQPWADWVRRGSETAHIEAMIDCDPRDVFGAGRRTTKPFSFGLEFKSQSSDLGSPRWELSAVSNGSKTANRSIWGANAGWFCASFGPFRRFTGGDPQWERTFLSNPRLAPHLSVFGEDVALTEGLRWLSDLHVRELEKSSETPGLLQGVVDFVNASRLLPHGAQIVGVTSSGVRAVDGGGAEVDVRQLSDGYRSVLSMIFEILRQMARAYGADSFLKGLDPRAGAVDLPGIVGIDEVDAHLHPSWQDAIGPWFTRCFPKVQFLVTTHSPIVCRAARTIWRLPAPGSEQQAGRIAGADFDRLTRGTILDAYGTEFFGRDVAASEATRSDQAEVARLNRQALRGRLTEAERARLMTLQRALPTQAASLADPD